MRQCVGRFEMLTFNKVLICIFGSMLIYDYYCDKAPVIIRVPDPEFLLLGPENVDNIVVNDTYNQLINMRNFTFLLNPQTCSDYPAGLLLVVIISSRTTHFKNRMVIRNTWGRSVDSTKVVFMIGESSDASVSQAIHNESLTYGDIVQGNFVDTYRNMTYKHVMGLKWVVHHCPTAKYILKTDDDVFVNSHELRRFLAKELSPWGAKGLITCQVVHHMPVIRYKSKWRVSLTEYPNQYYPNFCSGFAILYSKDVVSRLLTTAQNLPYFWIDDAHITGVCAEMIGVARTPLSSLVLSRERTYLLTTFGLHSAGQFLLGPINLAPSTIIKFWEAISE